MWRLWVWVKRYFITRWTQDMVCNGCASIIPFGKSAWYNKLVRHWYCDQCYEERDSW